MVTTVLVASLVTWWPTGAETVFTLSVSHRAGGGESVAPADRAHRAQRAGRPTSIPVTRTPESRSGSTATAPRPPTAGIQEPAVTEPEASEAGTSTTAPAPAASAHAPAARPDGGLGPVSFYGPNAGAARAAAQPGLAPEDAALLAELAGVPTATWLGAWSGDVATTVRSVVADAGAAGGVPVLVAYNIPGRDCGGYSAGGVDSPAAYGGWIQGIADGIGTAQAVVVLEPDALAQLCGDPAARYRLLAAAVEVLERNPGTRTYLDAGHAAWVDAATMADRLRAAGAGDADGFALNVSNFGTTANNVAYGQRLSALLDGERFVVDTSRNGNGPGSDWCNPPGRAVGERPTATTGQAGVDAYLWVKTPGESDGTCNGGPAAGDFWPEYALGLMRAA